MNAGAMEFMRHLTQPLDSTMNLACLSFAVFLSQGLQDEAYYSGIKEAFDPMYRLDYEGTIERLTDLGRRFPEHPGRAPGRREARGGARPLPGGTEARRRFGGSLRGGMLYRVAYHPGKGG